MFIYLDLPRRYSITRTGRQSAIRHSKLNLFQSNTTVSYDGSLSTDLLFSQTSARTKIRSRGTFSDRERKGMGVANRENSTRALIKMILEERKKTSVDELLCCWFSRSSLETSNYSCFSIIMVRQDT